VLRFPQGWELEWGADFVMAVMPTLGARMRYHERVRPQPRFLDVVETALAMDPAFRVRELGTVERGATLEGEYTAFIAVDGMRGHARARRWIGSAWLGEFATALDVLALEPARFAAVEDLARELMREQHFETTRRPRQFLYEPPAGWHGLPLGPIANWYPPDFPARRAVIVVHPATFGQGDLVEMALAASLEGLEVESVAREALRSAAGVDGTYVRIASKRLQREVAAFVVGGALYWFRLETTMPGPPDELRAVFREVATSFQAIPEITDTAVARVQLFDHWAR
jgi:hypothetical protein